MAGRSPAVARAATLRTSVEAALRSYADRGVFRGYSAVDGPRGTRIVRFLWLTRRPMELRLAPSQGVLTFAQLFPDVAATPGLAGAIRQAVRDRRAGGLPAHRRVDGRRAAVDAVVRRGDLALRVKILGRDGEYAVRASLALVNDLFLLLHECYPDYLIAHFGMTDE